MQKKEFFFEQRKARKAPKKTWEVALFDAFTLFQLKSGYQDVHYFVHLFPLLRAGGIRLQLISQAII